MSHTIPKSTVPHNFGGDWTERKLDVLEDYCKTYLIALKHTNFYKIYIDAFAGTGYRTLEQPVADGDVSNPAQGLFDSIEGREEKSAASGGADEAERYLAGSAVRALELEPGFDSYHFIELSAERVAELETLRERYPGRKITIHRGDASETLKNLLQRIPWHAHVGREKKIPRAVLFLDPYGLKVRWDLIQTIAATRAIDLWYLFPLGVGVNRLLRRDGQIPPSWRRTLDECFGTTDWYDIFYARTPEMTLFGALEQITKTADFSSIESFLLDRLKTEFAAVAAKPIRLMNSAGNPMYSFCFAAGNPKGAAIARRIADHILKHG